MGLTVTDTLSLVKNGYSIAEIQNVNAIITADTDNAANIAELAKKLKFSDLKQAIEIFSPREPSKEDTEDSKAKAASDENASDDGENQNAHSEDKLSDKEIEDVDYKAMYEKEKNLRETLQKANQAQDNSDKENNKSDFEIALEAATAILN